MKKLNCLDIFSGIGGFSLGLERTGGYKTVAFCEIDEHCHKVLKKHWPTTPIFTDVSKLKWNLSEEIDVICGGFPCTDISVAGKQKGLNDEFGNVTRSGLWFEYARLIGEIKPRYVIIENVAALRGNGLTRVLQDLRALGYDAEWHIISARAVGAYHLRERIWIIAYPCGERRGQGTSENLRSKIKKEYSKKSANIGGEKNSSGSVGHDEFPNADNLRLWKPFASTEEASRRWAETSSCVSDWWKVSAELCGIPDGVSRKLDTPESVRKQRIKQLGNSIVPQISEIIGKAILEWEAK